MTNTLLDHLQSVFTKPAVDDLAGILNENSAATQKALDGLIPTLTSGVVSRAESPEGNATLYRLLTTTPFETDPSMEQLVATDPDRRQAAESGNDLLRKLYDERVRQVPEATAQYSGVSLASATMLTGLVTSALMGYLHRLVASRNLTAPALATLLGGEAATARGAVPPVLAGLLGWFIGTGPSRPLIVEPVPVVPVAAVAEPAAAGFPWLRWLLIGLGLLLLFWLLTRACNRTEPETAVVGADSTADMAVVVPDSVATDLNGPNDPLGVVDSIDGAANAGSGAANVGGTTPANEGAALPKVRVAVDGPNGRKLLLTDRSFNYQLAKYLATRGSLPNKSFLFEDLKFNTNTARITPDAQEEVNDLIQIMNAYPKLHIRVVGYTDDVAGSDINQPLSAARSKFVKDALVQGGISANRITTEHEGESDPIATNNTAAGRERNRRVEIVVTQL